MRLVSGSRGQGVQVLPALPLLLQPPALPGDAEGERLRGVRPPRLPPRLQHPRRSFPSFPFPRRAQRGSMAGVRVPERLPDVDGAGRPLHPRRPRPRRRLRPQVAPRLQQVPRRRNFRRRRLQGHQSMLTKRTQRCPSSRSKSRMPAASTAKASSSSLSTRRYAVAPFSVFVKASFIIRTRAHCRRARRP